MPPPSKIPSLPLLSGASMPAIGLGTWRSDAAALHAAVVHAVSSSGYRHLDLAALYFNEHIVGAALAECISGGIVKREDLFLTSKLMPTDMHPDTCLQALEKSLASLQTPYLDLYLLHWPLQLPKKPSAFPVPVEERIGYKEDAVLEVWRVLEGAVDRGLVRALGVSNFSASKTEALFSQARHKPVCNQVELHPFLQQPELLRWHRERGVVVTAYCPLGSPARPPTFRHGQGAAAPAAAAAEPEPEVLTDPTLLAIAKKHGCTAAQVALRWSYQAGAVPLPKSVTPSRLDENISIFDSAKVAPLDDEDMAAIAKLDRGYRYSRGEGLCPAGTTWEQLWE
jgi:alcohol dehydrogenase (NADP+)